MLTRRSRGKRRTRSRTWREKRGERGGGTEKEYREKQEEGEE